MCKQVLTEVWNISVTLSEIFLILIHPTWNLLQECARFKDCGVRGVSQVHETEEQDKHSLLFYTK